MNWNLNELELVIIIYLYNHSNTVCIEFYIIKFYIILYLPNFIL